MPPLMVENVIVFPFQSIVFTFSGFMQEEKEIKRIRIIRFFSLVMWSSFFSHYELTLILNRVAEIRAANLLCSGLLLIKALSCLQKTEN